MTGRHHDDDSETGDSVAADRAGKSGDEDGTYVGRTGSDDAIDAGETGAEARGAQRS
jgi:hypothetical protein